MVMAKLDERSVVDEQGNRISIVLDIADYQALLDRLEELECLRAYDAAKGSRDRTILLEKAVGEIEMDRK
jgi:hypothetical protein